MLLKGIKKGLTGLFSAFLKVVGVPEGEKREAFKKRFKAILGEAIKAGAKEAIRRGIEKNT